MRSYSLASLGREAEAIEAFRQLEESRPPGLEYQTAMACRFALEGDREGCVRATERLLSSRFHDPEGLFFLTLYYARVGENQGAPEVLQRVVDGGFFCSTTMERNPWFAPLREQTRFRELVARATAARR